MQNESNKEPSMFLHIDEIDVQEWAEGQCDTQLTPEEMEMVAHEITIRDDKSVILFEVVNDLVKRRGKT